MQGTTSVQESVGGSQRLPQVVVPGSPGATPRGPSVGVRAYERLRQRSVARATEIRRERDERLNRLQLRVPDGAPAPRVATSQELEQVASVLNKHLYDVIQDPGPSGWYKLFNHIDDDGSGRISFFELEDMVRNRLKITASTLTQEQLQAIWRALDEDNSGLITCGEFGHFMRKGRKSKGEHPKTKMIKAKQKEMGAVRQEKQELLDKWRADVDADTAARREKASAQYAFDWGLLKEPSRTKPPWKSPRAYIF